MAHLAFTTFDFTGFVAVMHSFSSVFSGMFMHTMSGSLSGSGG